MNKKSPKKINTDLDIQKAAEKQALIDQTNKNAYHISVMNHEMGELRDAQLNTNTKLAVMSKDIEWVKKLGVSVVVTSIGSFLAIIAQFAWKVVFLNQ